MAKKKSVSQIAAEEAYFRANNIYIEKKVKSSKKKINRAVVTDYQLPASELGIGNGEDFGEYINALTNNKMAEYNERKKIKYLESLKYVEDES